MRLPKLTKPELRIMEVLWNRGQCSIREIHESLPARKILAYTTVQRWFTVSKPRRLCGE